MNPYPGVAPITVNTSGNGSPGVVVSTGASDPHGAYPTGIEATGNDTRNASTAMALGEALKDQINWLTWRVPDWIQGGDYSTVLTGAVTLGAQLSLLQQLTVHAAGGQSAGKFIGTSGILALDVQSIGAYAGSFVVNSGDGTAVLAEGHGAGHGGLFQGGTGNGHGVVGQAGASGGTGVKGIASGGGLAGWFTGGGTMFDTATSGSSQTGTVNQLFANNVIQATDTVTLTAGNSPALQGKGVNIASVALADASGGHWHAISVIFATPLPTANYNVFCTPFVDTATGNIYLPSGDYGASRLAAGFVVHFYSALGANTGTNLDTFTGGFAVQVVGGVT